jgi:pimeloyl-ACP methyl ester carboxylesterase/DNA-binding CsgD family transcriptional regulator
MATPRVRYLRTSDSLQLAWTESGSGPLLVSAGNWLTHLLYDVDSPVWGHWIRFFSDHFRFVRYDERGSGMTDWDVSDLSLDRWVDDLEAVVAAVGAREPFALMGICQGAAICAAYAVRHPERVSRLVLYGGFGVGWALRGDPDGLRRYEAIIELIGSGWSSDNRAFRRLFTSRFIPDATEQQLAWFDEHCRRVATPANAAALLRARAAVDASQLLRQVQAPTLVVHARDDATVPITQGRLLAAAIPNAEFIELPSRNHILLPDEPSWTQFSDAVLDFLGVESRSAADAGPFHTLTHREQEILLLIADGLGNLAIAEKLLISDKTVRNHISNLFDKLGVSTRAQAIVFARDHGFSEWASRQMVPAKHRTVTHQPAL